MRIVNEILYKCADQMFDNYMVSIVNDLFMFVVVTIVRILFSELYVSLKIKMYFC